VGWSEERAAFADAARWFGWVVGEVRDWDGPGLGEWTVRDLAGHTGRALLTVAAYLDQPAAAVEVGSAVDYFAVVLAASPAAVAERGRAAGAALGADPVAAVRASVGSVLDRVFAAGPDDLVSTPAGGMRLVDYLPTRTFELTVHGADLAVAVGADPAPPETAAARSIALLGALAARGGTAGPLLRAAAGRGPLPPGFTVL
jgi:uncharacterized protein (TIGR03083 family)